MEGRVERRPVRRAEPDDGVQQAFPLQHPVVQAEHRERVEVWADPLRGVQAKLVEVQVGGRDEHADLRVEVLLEIPADQVVVVPDAETLYVVGDQQQPRVLDRAGGQDEGVRLDGEPVAVQRGALDVVDPAMVVDGDPRHRRVEQQLEVLGFRERRLVAVEGAVQTELEHRRADHVLVERQPSAQSTRFPRSHPVLERAEVAFPLGSLAEGVERILAERPSVLGQAGTLDEVHRLQRRGLQPVACPGSRRAAERPPPREAQGVVALADVPAAGKPLLAAKVPGEHRRERLQ